MVNETNTEERPGWTLALCIAECRSQANEQAFQDAGFADFMRATAAHLLNGRKPTWHETRGRVAEVQTERDNLEQEVERLREALNKADSLFMDNGTISAAEYKIIETGQAIRAALRTGG